MTDTETRRDASSTASHVSVSRRRFLKLLGFGAIGAAAGFTQFNVARNTLTGLANQHDPCGPDAESGMSSGTGSAFSGGDLPPLESGASYDTITVASGDTHEVELGDGEAFTNKLIDITADDAKFRVRAEGANWEIRNIGVQGRFPRDMENGHEDVDPFRVDVPSENGSATIDNVYLGDGAVDGSISGIKVLNTHAGTVDISRVHVADWPHGGINATTCGWARNSNWPRDPGKGVVNVEQIYSHNCNVGGVMLPSTGSTLANSVIVVDDHGPARVMSGGFEGRDMNGVWVRGSGFDQDEIRNTHILITDAMSERSPAALNVGESRQHGPPPYGGDVRVVDSELKRKWKDYRTLGDGNIDTDNVGTSPQTNPPEGVPMNPEEAASRDVA